jgi:hypothetical protein
LFETISKKAAGAYRHHKSAHLVEALLVVCVAAGQREAMQRSRAGRLQLDNTGSIRLCHIILPLHIFILL